MREIAKKRAARQEPTTLQLVLPALEAIRSNLFGLVMHAGLLSLQAMLEEDRVKLCGPRYEHDRERTLYRAGHAPGELVMGGRRVSMKRPRVRSKDGEEVPLPTWEQFSSEDPLRERALEQMLIGVTTRKYERSLEAVPREVRTRGTSKSAVSRRFVEATTEHLEQMLGSPLNDHELVAVMIDGLYVGEHVVLVALGIDAGGHKHVLGLHEGATENAVGCTALLANLRDRGLRTDRSMLFVIDGSKALHKVIRDVFGARAVIQRCQTHKRRNVEEQLPEKMRQQVGETISAAYNSGNAGNAKRILTGLARQLERKHPSAAASLREGLDETLTVMRLGLSGALLRTLRTTNPIENLNGLIRARIHNVRNWKGGHMILRWVAAALAEAAKGFRRLRGYAEIPKLVAALRDNDAKLTTSVDCKENAA